MPKKGEKRHPLCMRIHRRGKTQGGKTQGGTRRGGGTATTGATADETADEMILDEMGGVDLVLETGGAMTEGKEDAAPPQGDRGVRADRRFLHGMRARKTARGGGGALTQPLSHRRVPGDPRPRRSPRRTRKTDGTGTMQTRKIDQRVAGRLVPQRPRPVCDESLVRTHKPTWRTVYSKTFQTLSRNGISEDFLDVRGSPPGPAARRRAQRRFVAANTGPAYRLQARAAGRKRCTRAVQLASSQRRRSRAAGAFN